MAAAHELAGMIASATPYNEKEDFADNFPSYNNMKPIDLRAEAEADEDEDGEQKPEPKKLGLNKFKKVAKAAGHMAAATKKRSNVPVISTKMDLAKALGILGFTSTRWLDQSSGLDPKEELDKAHFNQMMEITRKRKQQKKEEKQKEEEGKKAAKDPKTALALSAPAQPPAKRYAAKRKEFSVDDEVRILHEAYQFLLRKYKLGSYAEEDGEPSTDVAVEFSKSKEETETERREAEKRRQAEAQLAAKLNRLTAGTQATKARKGQGGSFRQKKKSNS